MVFFNSSLTSKRSLNQIRDDFQNRVFHSAKLGHNVTLVCELNEKNFNYMFWAKQTTGESPEAIANIYDNSNDPMYFDDFRDARFVVYKQNGKLHLGISETKHEDTATYYCGYVFLTYMKFGAGIFLMLTGTDSSSRTVVQQVVSDPVHPGDSVTLQCTVDSETCAGEHSVYWFRHGSGESLPGLIYTHGNRSDECEKSPEAGSPTHGCVYSLPKRNLSRSDAGIYYCAVATCGDILFGNGTKLDIDTGYKSTWEFNYIVLPLALLNIIFAIVIFLLVLKILKCHSARGKEGKNQEADLLQYAAVNISQKNKPKSKCRENVVYSEVSYLPQDWSQ
uniref:Novel immune-type receptor 9 n=1 Tax=Scleropages formosus TaxID=113540 RepID=A0A8C9S9Y4_SCLFO